MKRYVLTFYRHKWLYLIVLSIMLAVSVIGAHYLSKGYESSARIWVDRPTLRQALDDSPYRDYTTPAEDYGDMLHELIQTDWFMTTVLEHTSSEVRLTEDMTDDRQLAQQIRAKLWNRATGPNTIEVIYLSDDAVFSQQVVAGIIEEFRNWVFGLRLEESAAAIQYYEEQVQIYEEQTSAARESLDLYLVEHPDPQPNTPEFMELQRLQREYEAARNLHTAALIQYNENGAKNALASNYSPAEFRILDEPTVPTLPVATLNRQLKWLAPGLLASLTLIIGAIVLMTWQDQTIRSDADVHAITGVPVISELPHMRSRPIQAAGRSDPRGRHAFGWIRSSADSPAD